MDTMVLRNLTYGMFVLGTKDGSRPTGCTVNSVIQVTSEPLLIMACVNHQNFTNQCIKQSQGFSVSILSEETPAAAIGNFGFRSGRDTDKFASIPYGLTERGYPVLKLNTCGWLECTLESFTDLKTHSLFIGRVTGAESAVGSPMTYAYYHRVVKGKAPVNAPIFEKPLERLWTCPICGYQYDGSSGPFEDLPNSWKCPICGVEKGMFKQAG
ncbi:MAG: flavin reductase [Spirochaetaceae bacterium]|jgi:flavin reductase (DIM6/NTAB) family NADH-FMN oxidoreductase RutF/rubredoxin|nr:flavin reductase [Spirochaetaceae bacterium]